MFLRLICLIRVKAPHIFHDVFVRVQLVDARVLSLVIFVFDVLVSFPDQASLADQGAISLVASTDDFVRLDEQLAVKVDVVFVHDLDLCHRHGIDGVIVTALARLALRVGVAIH